EPGPDDHLGSGPDRGVSVGGSGTIRRAGDPCPAIGRGVIALARVQVTVNAVVSSKDDHLAPGPDRRVTKASGDPRGSCDPGVGNRAITASRILQKTALAAPDDHLAARPYCGVLVSRRGRGPARARRRPRVARGGIPAAGT